MTDKQFTLETLAGLFNAEYKGNKEHVILGVNSLETASDTDASFLANERYIEAMKSSQAGVICIDRKSSLLEDKNYLITDDPSVLFQKIAELFLDTTESFSGFTKIHPTAVVHESAKLGKDVTLGPYVVIDKNVSIGDNTFIGSHSYIGPHVKVGNNCILHPSVIIREKCIIHNRVILQPGCVIGSCGFGYSTNKMGQFEKLQQLGIVVIEDDVEIGANTTIDRARFKETKIRRGSKVDNLVQIAHNVEIGEDNALASQVGIAGSSKTGSHVIMGGQVGVTGHIQLGDKVMIAAQSGISKSHPPDVKLSGTPAIEISKHNRQNVHIRNLEKYVKQIKKLKQHIENLENKPKL